MADHEDDAANPAEAAASLRRLLDAVDQGELTCADWLVHRLVGVFAALDAIPTRTRIARLLYGVPVTSPSKTRAIGYLRLSKDEAERGASIDTQRIAIEAEAVRRGWDLELMTDDGYTAANLNRPAFVAAMAKLDARKADVLLATKIDRVSRDVEDFAGLMKRSSKGRWSLVCMDWQVDTTSASGELMGHMLVSAAHFERRRIAERTREVLATKKNTGIRLGRPHGLSPEVLDRVVAERATGASLATIAKTLTAAGTPTSTGKTTWHASTVASALKSAELDAYAAARRA